MFCSGVRVEHGPVRVTDLPVAERGHARHVRAAMLVPEIVL